MSSGSLRILHTNDLHGALTPAKLAALMPHRQEHDLWLDTGDAVKAGNLAIPMRPEPVWPLFGQGGLTAFCPGNRESHVWQQGVDAKFRGCQAPVLCSSWRRRDGSLLWRDGLIVEAAGLRIGLFGVMVAMVTPGMRTQAASQFLWDPPIEAAARAAALLRPQVDLLIAMTHIGLAQDRKLAEQVSGIDLILGGHSHSVLNTPEISGGVPIVQGGSHGRFWGSCLLTPEQGLASSQLHPWT